MPCYRPLAAWQLEDGEIRFVERGRVKRELKLPCGQCIGCRLERSRQWAVRCVHETQMHDVSSFVTLTYDDSNCPDSLEYSDFQLFLRRLRKRLGKARYFVAGEYGERTLRPHFHALLFGVGFPDRQLLKDSGGVRLYTSKVLSELWPAGFASVGDVTFESAAYVARYCVGKVTGDRAELHYRRVNDWTGEVVDVKPEFARMSLNPGIGADWFRKFKDEVLVRDGVVVRGRVGRTPRYYDNMLASMDGYKLDELKFERVQKAMEYAADQTPERLAVREAVAAARSKLQTRNVE